MDVGDFERICAMSGGDLGRICATGVGGDLDRIRAGSPTANINAAGLIDFLVVVSSAGGAGGVGRVARVGSSRAWGRGSGGAAMTRATARAAARAAAGAGARGRTGAGAGAGARTTVGAGARAGVGATTERRAGGRTTDSRVVRFGRGGARSATVSGASAASGLFVAEDAGVDAVAGTGTGRLSLSTTGGCLPTTKTNPGEAAFEESVDQAPTPGGGGA